MVEPSARALRSSSALNPVASSTVSMFRPKPRSPRMLRSPPMPRSPRMPKPSRKGISISPFAQALRVASNCANCASASSCVRRPFSTAVASRSSRCATASAIRASRSPPLAAISSAMVEPSARALRSSSALNPVASSTVSMFRPKPRSPPMPKGIRSPKGGSGVASSCAPTIPTASTKASTTMIGDIHLNCISFSPRMFGAFVDYALIMPAQHVGRV